MPGKKSDSKSAAKKGQEPEKGKGKGKDDKKGVKEDKKGGKDDKKKGKDEPPKGKGKDDGKKGKDKGKGKKVVSEPEEDSDAALIEDNEDLSDNEEMDEESEEDAHKRNHGKTKAKGKAAKGKSKSKHAASDEEEEDEEEDEEEHEADTKSKKKSKEPAGTHKKAKKKDAPEPSAEETKDTSKNFLGLSGIGRLRSSKKRLKSTSRLFLGLGKQKNFLVRKKRRKSFFKSAPRLLMGFRASKKKKKENENNNQSGKKPSYMILRLGGNKPVEKKTGLFKGLFRKKNADGGPDFKNQSRILGKVAGATNWLTKKFLSTKVKQRSQGRNGGQWGQPKTRGFSTGTQGLRGHHNYGYEEDYDEYDDYNPGVASNRQSMRRHPNRYGNHYAPDEYYEPDDEYPEGEYYDDGIGYYDESEMSYYPTEMGYYAQEQFIDPYYNDGLEYYDESQYLTADAYDPYGNEMEFYDQGQFDYYDDPQDLYDDPYFANPYLPEDYQFYYSELGIDPYLESSYNVYQPHGYTMADIMEADEVGAAPTDPTVHPGDMFRLPRPQVKLFGKERIPVERPPSPQQYDYEQMSEIQYETEPFMPSYFMDGGFPVSVYPHPVLPQIPTPTAMLIKQANSPNQEYPHMPATAQSVAFLPSPTPSRRSMGMISSPVHRPMSPMAAPREFGNVIDLPMQIPHASPQLFMHPEAELPIRRSPSPSQRFAHGFETRGVPLSPKLGTNVHRPPSPTGHRKMSPPASPVHFQARSSFIEPPSPQPMVRQIPSSVNQASHYGSIHRQSPHHSPHAPIRRSSPPSSPSLSKNLFDSRRFQGSPHRQTSPSVSRQTSIRAAGTLNRINASSPFASPTPSMRSFAVGSESPPGHRPSSPSPSHRSNHFRKEQPLFGPPSGQAHRMRRPNIPMGAVKPSLIQMSNPGAPTKHVPPFRASIRSNKSVMPQDFPASSHISGQHPGMVITEQRHFVPPGSAGSTRNQRRPVGRGRPLVTRQSVRLGPPSPQPSIKRTGTGPPSPQPSIRHLSRPTSPHPSIRHGSPLPVRAPSPRTPMPHAYHNAQWPEAPSASPFPPMPTYASDITGIEQATSPQLSNALQNPKLRNTAYTSVLHPAPRPAVEQYPEAALQNPQMHRSRPTSPHPSIRHGSPLPVRAPSPRTPMLSGAYQNAHWPEALSASPFQARVPVLSQSIRSATSPMPTYVSDITGVEQATSPRLSNALQNPKLRNTTYTSVLHPAPRPVLDQYPEAALQNPQMHRSSPLQPSMSPYVPEINSHPASPTLSRALQNPYLPKTPLHTPLSPYSQVVSEYDHVEEPGPGPLLTDAIQNPNVRNASYETHLQRRGSRYAPAPGGSPVLRNALQNQQIRDASYQTQLAQQRRGYRYAPMMGHAQDPRKSPVLSTHNLINTGPHPQQSLSPNLSNALQNTNMRYAAYRLPNGTIVTTDPQHQQPASPNLSRSLQNPLIRNASYRPRLIPAYKHPQRPPNVSHALINTNIRNASYRLPDGTVVFPEQYAKPTSPAVFSALQNTTIRNASYRLGDGTIVLPDYGRSKPTSPNLANALQNPTMRTASYQVPTWAQQTSKPTSPNLARALQNPNIRNATYSLPDENVISANPVRPPNLSRALQNADLRTASYRLPDGSVISPLGKPTNPKLADALKNQSLLKATYRLPDGSVFLADPQSQQTNPNLSQALLNQNLRSASYRLPDKSVLMQGFAETSSPQLTDALKNTGMKKASYQLPSALSSLTASGLTIGPDGKYAVVSPQIKGPDDHWARNAREAQSEEDVWAAERVLPHGTVQNLTKWSTYHDENSAQHFPPPPANPESRGREVQWVLDREGEPTGQWYDKMFSIRSLPTMRHREKTESDGIEDMTQLEELTEASVLINMKTRFERELIYTYIGSILLSINPYKLLNIYGTDVVLQYEGHGLAENPPHLFAIANLAYTAMMDAMQNQCIIISGESGSGKTEATKLVLRYLTAIHHERNVTQQIEILEAAPLLESFGNAKTVRNDNSSRFGKFVEIYLEEGVISGAITTQYLLEKSRIVFQAKSERNYHIFYEMLAGLPVHQRQAFYLQEAETYYYLNQGGDCAIAGKDDGQDFRRLQSAMDLLHFSPVDQSCIFRVLSSILHLGNVYFHRLETEVQETAGIVSAQEIRVVAELLQISPEGLQKAITYKVTEAMKEKIYTPLTVESAVDARDAVAKMLYSLLFNWLTERINSRVYPRKETPSISILDIYGFEELTFNSFEQLCINYANETLQYFFTKIILKQEQEEYIREQIYWRELSFTDNKACIDLIAAKPHGILRILDDQSCFPQATDHTFLQKCHYHHGENPLYSRPKMPQPEFTVKHFAGRVTYQVHKFLDKNYDQVRQEVLDLFIKSHNQIVSSMFLKYTETINQQRNGSKRDSTTTRRYQPSTVAAKFQQSLQELLDKMERCNSYFIRCIKPNNNKEPDVFEPELVATQLRCSGIMDTIHIRKMGYPVRMAFHRFLNRYKALLCLRAAPPADGDSCVSMLMKLGPIRRGDYQVGVSKIFLKEDVYQLLESKRDRVRHLAALTLQRYVRMQFARKNFVKFREVMTKLQARCRGFLMRKHFFQKRVYLIRFRSMVRLKHYTMERGRRQIIKMSQLVIPAELKELLKTTTEGKEVHSKCLALVEAPTVHVVSQLTLPLDINDHLMTKYIRTNFRELQFGMICAPLQASLTRLEENLNQDALELFLLVLRFMGDPNLNGAQENLVGNYIVQRGLDSPPIRDEILAQVANQVWRNNSQHSAERGWLLMAACLSCFAPSGKMAKYLLKFVSDYAPNGFRALCQHKLLHAMQKCQLGTEAARSYPLSLLEWTANRRKAHMVLQVHCLDGLSFLCPVHSWTTGEDLARNVLQHRGVPSESSCGWSVLMKDAGRSVELDGHDYVMDLMSQIELPARFPKRKSYIISTQDPSRVRPGAVRGVNGGGFDGEDAAPLPGTNRVSATGTNSLPVSDDRYSLGSDSSHAEAQRGMDGYVDSLFDPVLSDRTGDLDPSVLSRKMKGGGGVGSGQGDGVPPRASVPHAALPPRAVKVLPTMPVVPSVSTGPSPDHQTLMDQQQQAFINQQAAIMAQQMTMQAMAMMSSPISSPPTSPPPSFPLQPSSPYPAVPPSLYANLPPSPYAQFTPSSYTIGSRMTSRPGPSGSTHQHKQSTESEATPPAKLILAKNDPVTVSGQKRSARAPATEVVKYSVSNSEHIVPSHNIKDIIRQYQTPAEPAVPESRRRDGNHFARKKNPHDEAMDILKTHMDIPPPPQRRPPDPVLGSRQQVPIFPRSTTEGAPAFPLRTPGAVSRDLPVESETIQTSLQLSSTDEHYTYTNVPWKIYIRKEVFYPRDSWNHPLVLDIIFKQIVNDTFSDACVRITQEERLQMKSLFKQHVIEPDTEHGQDESVKRVVVMAARDSWEIYFSRLFPASGSVGTGVQTLAVSHSGIKLLKTVQSGTKAPDYFQVLRSYRYSDILFVTVPSPNMLEFNLTSETLILFSAKTPQIKYMVDEFISQLKKDSQYAVAERNYITNEQTLLSFHKGDLICLQPRDRLQEGQLYGCVVKKKVVYLEEVKRDASDFGWRFGAVMGRSGAFPAGYVVPVAAPDFLNVPSDGEGAPRDGQGEETVSSFDQWTSPEASGSIFLDTQYNMVEFARKYFRQSRVSKSDSPSKGSRDPAEMIKFSQAQMEESLIELTDPSMNRVASEMFLAVMKFMGDHPLRGQSEHFVLCTFLKLVGQQELMRDEAYCQVLKQITANTSSKHDSCQKGWRLLYILSAFVRCSEVLRPFLLKFFRDACTGAGAQFQGIAKVCEQNLKKTCQFGGRTVCPSSMELQAIMAGRSSKRQLFLLPGGLERHLKIKTCTVVLDVIEELCFEMTLQRLEALDEYTIFIVLNRGRSVRPLNKREYVLDVAGEAEMTDSSYGFWFRRVIWAQPLKFDNELSVTVHYNQVLPDYLKGLLNVLPPGKVSEQQFNQIAKLAALQHRAKNGVSVPTMHELVEYIPAQLFSRQGPQQWKHLLVQHTHAVQSLSPHQARSQFLGLVSAFPMFGSSFFYILSSNNSAVSTPCILAVNLKGLHFLHRDTHEVFLRFSLMLVQSTHTQRPRAGASYPYVDVLLGNMTNQRTTQLQLEQGLELCRVVAMHVENLLSLQEKRLNLPPSEITLL